MIKGSYLITTLFLLTGLMLEAQVCPMGTIWDSNKMTCVKKDNQKNMEVVNFKCPNGYSWVSFKKECLTNVRVKEIYDSLTIEYLADPQVVDRKKLDEMAENSTAPTETIAITAEDVASITAELTALKEEIKALRDYNEKLKTALGDDPAIIAEKVSTLNSSTGMNSSLKLENAEELQMAILSNSNDLKELKETIQKISSQNMSLNSSLYTFDVGKQHGVVAKTDMYGQKDIKFQIICPTGFKWVADESICLSADMFLQRSQAKAQNPNAVLKYGIKDVKCPKSFRWSSMQSKCIPTLHAKLDE